ncbi:MAG: GNAT family N-acetyltransferase [Synergistaceae bacterium]|jgi:RimJ/RimL family protein N-acetyltransferase|nr:GNAT family N-acetyltransferase [Synergistaceae bacterium]
MDFYTNRLHIRPVNIKDNQSIFKYRSDSETHRYLSLIPETVEDVSDFISRTSNEINIPGTWFQFVIIEQDSDTLIGDIGIHFLETDSENMQAEIGYTLDLNYRGKGYATEALTEIIDYLINDLNKHRIIASIDPSNSNSIRLIERLGFTKEAHFKESLFFHGEWVDDLIYAILAKEWKSKKD